MNKSGYKCVCGEPDPNFCEVCNRIRVEAIKEKLERDNPKPLTIEQLKERVGKPVWVADKKRMVGWAVVGCVQDFYISLCPTARRWWEVRFYGTSWFAYDHEPKPAKPEYVAPYDKD